ncbi:MAG: CoA transferase [Acidimicrobiales bacterium]|jgi:benzylsuccinate CoA-transferase BbsF subunit|nr:CoA transferase [Acidimicrobiales bacterium]
MASSSAGVPSLLDGLRVISLGAFVAGNVCPLLLAELGADVVKVESRWHPEALRAYDFPDHVEHSEPSGVRTTALFAGLTRSTRSVGIDMASGDGRAAFEALVERADVLVENLAPGRLASWGFSFDVLRAGNPRLVMLSMSGYGRTGPLASYRAYASNINNYLGLTAAWAPDGTHFDFVAGVHGAHALVAALGAVENGAAGVFIDLAQTEAGATLMGPLYLDCSASGREWSADPNEVPGALLSGAFRCRGDDAWVAIELTDARDWSATCSCLAREDLDLIGTQDITPDHVEALRAAIGSWAATVTPLQAARALQAAGVAAGPVQNGEDLWHDAQLRSRGAFVELDHPDLGVIEYPNTPSRLTETPGRVTSRGPRLGEHTTAVFEEWLGLRCDEVDDLVRRGAIWQAE